MNDRYCHIAASRETGIALITAIICVLLMSVIALYLSRSSTLDLRLSSNKFGMEVSFDNAESARSFAENTLLSIGNEISASGGIFDCTDMGVGYYAPDGIGSNCSTLDTATLQWDADDSMNFASTANAGRYVIEYRGVDEIQEPNDDVDTGSGTVKEIEVHVFRVLSHGVEVSAAQAVVETVFIVRKS